MAPSMPKTRSPSPKTKRRSATAQDVMKSLGNEYGPVEWTPRHSPASELVYTILSQHTSDANSERAFDSLMQTFGSLEAVADAPVEHIEGAIRTGGLARVKAPRIKAVLNQVAQEVGSYDLSFLSEMPLDEAKAWLRKLPGIGPKTRRRHPVLLFGHAGHAGGHPYLPRLKTPWSGWTKSDGGTGPRYPRTHGVRGGRLRLPRLSHSPRASGVQGTAAPVRPVRTLPGMPLSTPLPAARLTAGWLCRHYRRVQGT